MMRLPGSLWIASTLALLTLTALALPGVAPRPVVLDQGHITPLHTAEWRDAHGSVHHNITGEGVLVFNDERITRHPDLNACLDRGWDQAEHGYPEVASDTDNGHGTLTTGVLCGDGTMSHEADLEEPIIGVAPDIAVWTRGAACASIYPVTAASLCDIFDPPEISIYSHSFGDSPTDTAERHAGISPNDDVLLVSAAENSGGNGSTARTWYEDDPRVVMVAAANGTAQQVADYSSRGAIDEPASWPDITAPGCMFAPQLNPIGIYTSLWGGFFNGMPTTAGISFDGYDGCLGAPPVQWTASIALGYAQASGTSLATPYVSGVAALMHEVNPALTAIETKYLLTRTADPFLADDPTMDAETFYEGFGYKAGYGLVNATAAVAAAHYMTLDPDAGPPKAVDAYTLGETGDGRLALNPTND